MLIYIAFLTTSLVTAIIPSPSWMYFDNLATLLELRPGDGTLNSKTWTVKSSGLLERTQGS